MKCLLLLLIALTCFTISSSSKPVCQCAEYDVPICARYWREDAVFVGQLRDITPPDPNPPAGTWPMATLHFIVEQPFRGITSATVDVGTASGTSCSIQFDKGKRYLIYAHRNSETLQLFTGMCMGGGEIEDVEEDLKYIRSVMQQGVTESIVGRVVRGKYTPVTGVKVEVRNENKTFQTTSDENGNYSVSVAGTGTYSVKVLVPSSVAVMSTRDDLLDKMETTDALTTIEYKVELGKSQCDYRQFDTFPVDLHATAEVSGFVLTASGRPVDQGYVYLQRTSDGDRSDFTKIEGDGSFKFEGVPVGEFHLVLNPRNEAPGEDDPPYARVFYPNATDVSGATKIVVTEGAKLENLTLRVGRAFKARTVSGKVVWEKGGPGAGASLSIYNGDQYVRSATADKKGLFSFKLYGDFKYSVHAHVFGVPYGKSDPVAITDKSTNLTLVVKPR
ncbi:MAG TPA: carboxypeptidase-like regulatory domain-containing protein [Pyrinomonadaceae bacterium]|nr:carboxypeptidase-like regulatory domain-containing protein [Pyrinomonadaceae bacterium]